MSNSNPKFKTLFGRLTAASDELACFEHFDLGDADKEAKSDEEKKLLASVRHDLNRAIAYVDDALSTLDPDDEWGGDK